MRHIGITFVSGGGVGGVVVVGAVVGVRISLSGALLRRIVLSANSARRELYSIALTNTALRLALFAEYSSRIR